MLLEAETNKYCPGGYDFGAIPNLITWVLNFFLSVCLARGSMDTKKNNLQVIVVIRCLSLQPWWLQWSIVTEAVAQCHNAFLSFW